MAGRLVAIASRRPLWLARYSGREYLRVFNRRSYVTMIRRLCVTSAYWCSRHYMHRVFLYVPISTRDDARWMPIVARNGSIRADYMCANFFPLHRASTLRSKTDVRMAVFISWRYLRNLRAGSSREFILTSRWTYLGIEKDKIMSEKKMWAKYAWIEKYTMEKTLLHFWMYVSFFILKILYSKIIFENNSWLYFWLHNRV